MDKTPLFPLYKGDNFFIGPYHFVCMGWRNGRIRAVRHEEGIGFIMHSLSMDIILTPGFRITSRANKES